jgi:hypothetical protein
MSDPNPKHPSKAPAEESGAEQAHAALVARLARFDTNPVPVRPPKSLQPTPEASMTRASRLRRKRLLIQRSKRTVLSQQTLPPARDPLAP